MSESSFLKDKSEEFLAAHQQKDGWKVYKCSDRLQYEMSLRYLMDFTRDTCPTAVKKRATFNEVRTEEIEGVPGKSRVIEAGSEWDLQRDLDVYDWNGIVDIEWQSQPIHYLRLLIRAEGGAFRSVALVASKSNLALREFLHALDAYGHARDARPNRHVIVINGADFPVPKVSWNELILRNGMASEIRGNIDAFFKPETRDHYRELGIPHRRGFIFTGPPGCGKTMTLKALVNSTDATFVVLQARAEVDEGELERAFFVAKRHAPAVVIFEDIDQLVKSRNIAVSYFLNVLDGLHVLEGVLVIATSNNPERLDPALLHRPSRFDRVWRFSLPNKEQRLALLKRKGSRYFSEQVLRQVAAESNGFSMAYVQEIVINALLDCAHEGKAPADNYILKSLSTLKNQRRVASKPDEDIAERESIGFVVSNQQSDLTIPEPKLLADGLDNDEGRESDE